jgi:hypothetical protein
LEELKEAADRIVGEGPPVNMATNIMMARSLKAW